MASFVETREVCRKLPMVGFSLLMGKNLFVDFLGALNAYQTHQKGKKRRREKTKRKSKVFECSFKRVHLLSNYQNFENLKVFKKNKRTLIVKLSR